MLREVVSLPKVTQLPATETATCRPALESWALPCAVLNCDLSGLRFPKWPALSPALL